MSTQLLTVTEVAEVLACSRRTVLRLIGSGTIPAFRHRRLVRVSEHALDEFIHERIIGRRERARAILAAHQPVISASRPARDSRQKLWDTADRL